VSYLSGGVDSSVVVALATDQRRRDGASPIPTFTIRVRSPEFDEAREALLVARHIGARPVVVDCGRAEVLQTYPELIRAAEGPVIDTSCAALLLLAREVHRQGYKVALTGEGADEWLAGYPWFKVDRLLGFLDVVPGLRLSQLARRAFLWLNGAPKVNWALVRKVHEVAGGHNAWMDFYGLVSMNKLRFFSPPMLEAVAEHNGYADLGIPQERVRRWHPLNRALYLGMRVHLPGHLLNAKGDRVAMHSSVETRYPFLDEDVFDYLAPVHPRWKLRGFEEKYLLRRLAERWLPASIARRRKAMFRAPLDSFFGAGALPPFIDQLLSDESLRRAGYFDAQAVRHWRDRLPGLRAGSSQRTSVEMGLVGVLATQLWHHTFIDGGLAELPSRAARAVAVA
jgi:asparagine synthase (glutamine-hydrolysing)